MVKKKKIDIPEDKKKQCDAIIHSHAVACGGVGTGMAQLPLADNAVITPIQIAMILELGAVFGQNITKSAAQSIISGAAASLLGRSVSQALWGWIPVVGNAINTATAAGLTEAIGWMAVDKFSKDEAVDRNNKSNETNKEKTEHGNTMNEKGSEEETETDEQYKELMQEADLYISQEKNYMDNMEDFKSLLKKMENAMKKLPKDHPLCKKYDELAEVPSNS